MLIGLLAAAGLPCLATSQMLDITPNGIVYLTQADTIQAGTAHNVIVQIQYNGAPVKSKGVRVYFLANDTSIVPAELGTFVLTDDNGNATYTVTPNKTGDVKLTASAMSTNSGISVDKKFHVAGGPVATPTATPAPSPSPSPSPAASVTATAAPSNEPTPTAVPTTVPTATPMATPTAVPPTTGNANAQATGIIAAGIAIAIILIVILLASRMLGKK